MKSAESLQAPPIRESPQTPGAAVTAGVYAVSLATSAVLLFAAQPLVARLALPILGGSPAVWNTCMVFFQTAVLAGYALAHALATRACPQQQVAAFLVLIVLGGAGLPITLGAGVTSPPDHPLAWLLGHLAREIGLPSFALATASPLLQHWFAATRSRSGEPYFLYAASNAGSLGALLAYPAIIEPTFPLPTQARLWTGGYVFWAAGVVLAAALMFRALRGRPRSRPAEAAADTVGNGTGPVRLTWIALAAIPASLLQGCTLFLTTDVASLPLLWVVPLAVYLLTFVIAFSERRAPFVHAANRVLPFLAAALLYAILSRSTEPVALLMALHLAFLFAAGLVCHGRLVELRPAAERLTSFYLALSVGGVLGGAFNALLAPHLFDSVVEYPIAIALTAAALRRRAPRAAPSFGTKPGHPSAGPPEKALNRIELVRDLATALALGLGVAGFGLVFPFLVGETSPLRNAVVFGAAAVACCTLLDRPRRLTFGLGATFAAGLWLQGLWAGHRYAERNFFGITRVARSASGEYHQLIHGNTIHGRQFLDPRFRDQPLTYYHRAGPLGRIFEDLPGRSESPFLRRPRIVNRPPDQPRRIGVIGLGIGSMAAYALPTEDWTFFEIDPAVIRVAQDTNWFTFLSRTRARAMHIVPGDARLRLAAEPDGSFDLLLLDAFSSDAIPVHLLTREAVALYFRKLRPTGWLAAHISNRYLDLEPVVAGLAQNAGWAVLSGNDMEEANWPGKEASHWMVLARTPDDLYPLSHRSHWVPALGANRIPVWTDHHSAVLPLIQWQ